MESKERRVKVGRGDLEERIERKENCPEMKEKGERNIGDDKRKKEFCFRGT